MTALRRLLFLALTVVLVGMASAQRVIVPRLAPVVVTPPVVPIPQLPRGVTPLPAPSLRIDRLTPAPSFRTPDGVTSGHQASPAQTATPLEAHTSHSGGPGGKPSSEGDDGKDEKGRDWSWLKWLIAALVVFAFLRRRD